MEYLEGAVGVELFELKSSVLPKFLPIYDDLMGLIQKHGNEAEYMKDIQKGK